MIYILSIFVFSVLYALKGGSGKTVFHNWNRVRAKNKILNFILDGKKLGFILAWLFIAAMTGDIVLAFAVAAAWLLSVAPSMGEEHGAIGRWKHSWGDYIDYSDSFGRLYGVKKGIQRGVFIGACMALATGYVPFICFSLLFVPCVYVGQEVYYRITKRDSWVWSEPLIGAVVYGIPVALWLQI